MFDKLYVINRPGKERAELDYAALEPGSFVLETCQRDLVVFFGQGLLPQICEKQEIYYAKEAYHFLLQVICGLKSQMMGETEIVCQFKEALKDYLTGDNRHPLLIKLIEKLLKDSKEVRSEYLREIGQKTYSGIVRRMFLNSNVNSKKILIVGTGKLAIDIINQLKKKSEIYITGRNTQKVNEIAKEHDILTVPWLSYEEYQSFNCIALAIGADNLTLFDDSFMTNWKELHKCEGLFIDLGGHSTLESTLGKENRVYRLEDILKQGVLKQKDKQEKISRALEVLDIIAQKRMKAFAVQLEKQSWAQKTKSTELELEAVSSL